jgi:WD40 repeat protein
LLKLKKTLTGHASGIYTLVSDGKLLFSGSGDGILAAWDMEKLEPAALSVKVGEPVFSALVLENILLIGQGKGGVHVVDRKSKKEIRHLKYHEKGVFSLLHNPDQKHFYSVGGGGSLAIIDSEDYQLLMQVPLSDNKMRKLLLSPDNRYLLVSGSDGNIHILDTGYFNQLATIHAHEGGTYAMRWARENKLITAGRDSHIRIWDFSPEGLIQTEKVPAHNYAIYDLAMGPGGQYASASRDRLVKTWNLENPHEPHRLIDKGQTSHSHSVNALFWGEKYLFSGGDDRVIRVWASKAGKVAAKPQSR